MPHLSSRARSKMAYSGPRDASPRRRSRKLIRRTRTDSGAQGERIGRSFYRDRIMTFRWVHAAGDEESGGGMEMGGGGTVRRRKTIAGWFVSNTSPIMMTPIKSCRRKFQIRTANQKNGRLY